MNDLTYLEALEARHTQLDSACSDMRRSILATWDEGRLVDTELFDLIEREEEYERLDAERTEIWALVEQAQGKNKGLEQKADQTREDPAQ